MYGIAFNSIPFKVAYESYSGIASKISQRSGKLNAVFFTDFDIKFNQLISLIETRLSGALLAIKSFIVIEEPYTAP